MKIDNWKKRLAVALCVLLGIGVLGNLVYFLRGGDAAAAAQSGETVAVETEPAEPKEWAEPIEIPADGISRLRIDWVVGNVTLETGDIDQIRICETQSKKELEHVERDGELLIRYSDDTFTSMLKMHSKNGKDLTVTVPASWEGQKLELQVVSANVTIRDLRIRDMDYDGVSGKLNAENCQLGQVSMQTVSGNVSVSGTVEELECESVSADCSLFLTNVPREISLEGVSGSLLLTLPENAGFTAELDGVTNELKSDFALQKQDDRYVAGDGSCEIEIEGISGQAEILKQK